MINWSLNTENWHFLFIFEFLVKLRFFFYGADYIHDVLYVEQDIKFDPILIRVGSFEKKIIRQRANYLKIQKICSPYITINNITYVICLTLYQKIRHISKDSKIMRKSESNPKLIIFGFKWIWIVVLQVNTAHSIWKS